MKFDNNEIEIESGIYFAVKFSLCWGDKCTGVVECLGLAAFCNEIESNGGVILKIISL